MPTPAIRQLPAELQPLLNKFYRAQRSQMRGMPGASCWVAMDRDIIAGLCLTPVAEGYWLTGLLVAPGYRSQGLARRLIEQALESVRSPVWLFCHPRLAGFYARLGFVQTPDLPEPLHDRLQRYARHKPLIAFVRNEMTQPILRIVTACLHDEQGRILLVRKRGTHYFMLPGGKAEADETALMTVKRELHEELALELDDADLQWLGHFQAPAANEPGHWVEAEVFIGKLSQTPRVQAEIEEIGWLEPQAPEQQRLAPLLRERILPVLNERAAAAQ